MTKLEHWFGHLVHFLDAANCCMLSGQTWKPIGHSSEQDSAQAVHWPLTSCDIATKTTVHWENVSISVIITVQPDEQKTTSLPLNSDIRESGVSAQLVHYLVRLSAQWVSKFGHSACNNWPHPGNEPSVQTSVQAWSWHMHNLYATWTCLMFFVHYLIAARILLATTRPCDVSNTMAHAWIVHYFTHASRAIFSQQ